jgi:hypothetical protein
MPHCVWTVESGTRVVLQFDVFVSRPADAEEEEEEEEEEDESSSSGDSDESMQEDFYTLTHNEAKTYHEQSNDHSDHYVDSAPWSSNMGLAGALNAYWTTQKAPVAFLLRHQYINDDLSLEILKGSDAALAEVLLENQGLDLALEYVIAHRNIAGGDYGRGESQYRPQWGPLGLGSDATTRWSAAAHVKLIIGPRIMYERATELDRHRAAEHTGNEPMDGHETYLFAALVVRPIDSHAPSAAESDDDGEVAERPHKRARI